jgi:hypothetical protein
MIVAAGGGGGLRDGVAHLRPVSTIKRWLKRGESTTVTGATPIKCSPGLAIGREVIFTRPCINDLP